MLVKRNATLNHEIFVSSLDEAGQLWRWSTIDDGVHRVYVQSWPPSFRGATKIPSSELRFFWPALYFKGEKSQGLSLNKSYLGGFSGNRFWKFDKCKRRLWLLMPISAFEVFQSINLLYLHHQSGAIRVFDQIILVAMWVPTLMQLVLFIPAKGVYFMKFQCKIQSKIITEKLGTSALIILSHVQEVRNKTDIIMIMRGSWLPGSAGVITLVSLEWKASILQ